MIEIQSEGGVAVVTIQRPQRRNALASEIVSDLDSALVRLNVDEGIGAVVLTGAAPSFCAGSDLKELGGLDIPGMVGHELETARVARRIGMLDIPVVAAVEGHALAAASSWRCPATWWSAPPTPDGAFRRCPTDGFRHGA